MREVERVHGAKRPHLQRLNAVDHVIDRTRRGSKVKYVIQLPNVKGPVDVELLEFEVSFAPKVVDVRHPSGEKIVHGYDRVTFREQSIA
jgi:hypothetical protein